MRYSRTNVSLMWLQYGRDSVDVVTKDEYAQVERNIGTRITDVAYHVHTHFYAIKLLTKLIKHSRYEISKNDVCMYYFARK